MFILQHTHTRVNMQTPYRFQSFLSQYVSLLDTKNPGERVLLGAVFQMLLNDFFVTASLSKGP